MNVNRVTTPKNPIAMTNGSGAVQAVAGQHLEPEPAVERGDGDEVGQPPTAATTGATCPAGRHRTAAPTRHSAKTGRERPRVPLVGLGQAVATRAGQGSAP